jgi:hypothetical protein
MTVIDAPVDRIDQITTEAREVQPGRALLGLIATLLIAVGRLVGLLVMATAWSYVAVRTGYRDVRRPVRRSGGGG